jgi:SAM-dependent methyltransferase
MLMDLAKKALASPAIFDAYQSLIGAPDCHRRFIHDMVSPIPGERILDVGCGVGASLRYVPHSVDYVGIDVSEAYIAKAKADYGHRAKFICADVTTLDAMVLGTFDRAFCFGVLHHLSDGVAAEAVDLVRRVIKPGGVFVSIDPCHIPAQHVVAKLLIGNDRGEYVRDPAGFERITSSLGRVQTRIYNDLLRIPYTQIVMRVEIKGDTSPMHVAQVPE